MTEEQIEKAAQEQCTTEGMEQWKKDYGMACFTDGARWRIDEAWHDVSVKPDQGQEFIYQAVRYSGTIFYNLNCIYSEGDWEFINEVCNIERWAYVADLLPDINTERP